VYVVSFETEVREFLRFAPRYQELGQKLARSVTEHATPVGSGTVARTERIPIERRAESAVIAWLRHQTTAYDTMKIERVAGRRREVRRELATLSRAVLDLHRRDVAHATSACPLCKALI
jgi:16S rRNA U516 pseudouridylate synthase RsuA-like enzyme